MALRIKLEESERMKYLCLCYYDPAVANALSADEAQELAAVCKPHYRMWQESGRLGAIGALSDPRAWKTIRPMDSSGDTDADPQVADGPYLPDGHRIGAFFFVEASNINEAAEIAAKHPSAHAGRFLGGGIEVCVCEGCDELAPNASAD
ncbi:YciI family protein [Rhizobacter sp. LjRoot28]|uniref:YciI family protein n=1 Tax=Rhizobacter sp. LjRoot28 TaxID=3342309 RepID=UPI003ECE5D5D